MSTPNRHPRTLTRQLTIAGVLLGVLQAAIFALLIGAVRSADVAESRADDILRGVQTVSDLEKSVIDAETGMRGFVITGREEFLDPMNQARGVLPEQERLARQSLEDRDERVVVRLGRDDDRAVLEVQDTGIGISQADLERLFQRFFRTARATSAAIPGVGLGLAIAQAIVHGHDGEIGVQSADGEGTTFRIELPLHRTAEVTA